LSFRGVSDVLEKLSKKLYASIFQKDVKISAQEIIAQLDEAEKILVEQHNDYSERCLMITEIV
jgi:phosphoenolpyruvate carboxylase